MDPPWIRYPGSKQPNVISLPDGQKWVLFAPQTPSFLHTSCCHPASARETISELYRFPRCSLKLVISLVLIVGVITHRKADQCNAPKNEASVQKGVSVPKAAPPHRENDAPCDEGERTGKAEVVRSQRGVPVERITESHR